MLLDVVFGPKPSTGKYKSRFSKTEFVLHPCCIMQYFVCVDVNDKPRMFSFREFHLMYKKV